MINRLTTNRSMQSADRADRRAFTLVELLIVMVVIAILSSMVIMALTTAAASAKDVHTRATITKLHDLIMQKYESYQTRRLPLAITGVSRTDIGRKRLDALRDLMRMEMPDRFTDFTLTSEASPYQGTINAATKQSSLSSFGGNPGLACPSVTKHYQQRFASSGKLGENESGECLYMIIAYGLQNQEALERFSESEIGDTDGDGLPEFIDAWGKAILFIRSPALYPSELQMPGLGANFPDDPHNESDSKYINFTTNYLKDLASKSHDPFDPLKLEKDYTAGSSPNPNQFPAYQITPLIYSGGPDRIYDIDEVSTAGRPINLANKPFQSKMPGAPYDKNTDGQKDWTDNVTNHDLLTQ